MVRSKQLAKYWNQSLQSIDMKYLLLSLKPRSHLQSSRNDSYNLRTPTISNDVCTKSGATFTVDLWDGSQVNRVPKKVAHIIQVLEVPAAIVVCSVQHLNSATGWSKETVDCNFLLTDPKISKSVITQLFLESLYREVFVFWCFISVRCVEFWLLMHFQYRAFVSPC